MLNPTPAQKAQLTQQHILAHIRDAQLLPSQHRQPCDSPSAVKTSSSLDNETAGVTTSGLAPDPDDKTAASPTQSTFPDCINPSEKQVSTQLTKAASTPCLRRYDATRCSQITPSYKPSWRHRIPDSVDREQKAIPKSQTVQI